MKRLWEWLPNLWAHPLAAAGTVVTTVTGCTLVFVLASDFAGSSGNTYASGFLLIALPALFLVGLLLIPVGIWLDHKRPQEGPRKTLAESVSALFTTPKGRRKLYFVGGLTLVNIILLASIGHRAVTWMDSPTFCGTACHEVMQPEYDSYRESPHARVKCVECHIGPGASFAVRAKIDGLRQVWRTLLDTYERPVPSPVHTLRPSRDTCEKCHWPDHFHGNRVASFVHTRKDEANTAEATVLLLKVGGRDQATGDYHGIHWHVAKDMEVRYEALDRKRETIGKVTVLKEGKVVREYLPPPEAKGEVAEARSMDCIDCHNRPTHVFDFNPGTALDRGFDEGILDRSTKWLREVGESVLAKTDYPLDDVTGSVRKQLVESYKTAHADAMPDAAKLDAAAAGLARLWKRNVFPLRKVTWGTYPRHLGHQSATPEKHGCFRCHDEKHKTADGKVLPSDCEICHETLAQEEEPSRLDDTLKALLGTKK